MNTLSLGMVRTKYEIIAYFREFDALFFTFLFPIIMLGIFSAAFSSQTIGTGADRISLSTYYLPAMAAAGLLLSGVQNLAIAVAQEKSDGTLKTLGGTPLPPLSYFVGKLTSSLLTGAVQLVLLIAVSHFAFGVELPTDPARYLDLLWIFVLGILACGLLGLALSAVPRSGRSATAVVIPVLLFLQFISGVYLPFSQLPSWMQTLASFFPLKWLAQGMRSVFLPDSFKALEVGHAWNLDQVALVVGGWLIVGLVLTRLTFRWIRKDA
ncbi:ABC transporter permease [Gryllotalpicola protaetiae]|uniref:Transport permease protein n=1 Tax=Gryllotalpicola protaetiae TaxID=2419771 RepID=A0A387BGY0_9MICO|nr:ABC transporter permease [Gryllotalpicola protaetiae]AYG03265.1 ABC transporter permease [Gryllotalpicola protaetiae]